MYQGLRPKLRSTNLTDIFQLTYQRHRRRATELCRCCRWRSTRVKEVVALYKRFALANVLRPLGVPQPTVQKLAQRSLKYVRQLAEKSDPYASLALALARN